MQDPKKSSSGTSAGQYGQETYGYGSDTMHSRSGSDFGDQAMDLIDQAQRAVESAAAATRRTINDNPTLALAGAVAFGAVAILLVRNRMSRPETTTQKMQRGIERQARSIRRAVRQELRSHDFGSRFDQIGSSLSNFDLKPYLQPLLEQAAEIAGKAKTRLNNAAK